ncbi:MAG: ornithine cyclodeaminase family protein [Pirellulaceae bacterium]
MSCLPPLMYLSAADVRRALPMSDAIAAMREAFLQFHAGQVNMPPRGRMDIDGQNGALLLMPCHVAAHGRVSLKCLTVSQGNPARGLPLIHALLILTDALNGAPLAIMDGASVTAIRTGAVSGLATDFMARKDASVVALFGAGTQSRTQLEAVCAVRSIRAARVFDIARERKETFAREMSEQLDVEVESVDTPARALRDADVVCTATTTHEPVFRDSELPPRVHINAVGAFSAEYAEVPSATVQRARIVVDHVAAALEEAGDLLRPLAAGLIDREHFSTELGQVISGDRPGRCNADEVTLFKSVGIAIQDLFAAMTVHENAIRLKLGVPLQR